MQIAEILSDLTSLRVCDPSAALALVSACPSTSPTGPSITSTSPEQNEDDVDLKRAKNLVELHYLVKVAHAGGAPDQGILAAREAVRSAVGG
ncbi:hypothetical protein K432DRAFT_321517 [Lepidopterella palustris CBS 459.81]|uniref:Uncharacterized protein n=1 Tax=Lepidopterella palustris CBS 459.81 TaxID=1314670 RepID=A0A8E2JJ09_9PEZI|nr:hypothetical protein K432DRAFT_321517 [Lepidopterella palustris CBS 459.81]